MASLAHQGEVAPSEAEEGGLWRASFFSSLRRGDSRTCPDHDFAASEDPYRGGRGPEGFRVEGDGGLRGGGIHVLLLSAQQARKAMESSEERWVLPASPRSRRRSRGKVSLLLRLHDRQG
ncbi:hypothetical protein MASR2M17_09320 [Aminivibrio sp.]